MFQIGQMVYTNREIRGWFDFSLKSAIPANSRGIIAGCITASNDLDLVEYEVEFGSEFGRFHIYHKDLKLG